MSVSVSLNNSRAFTRESILLVAGGAGSGLIASLLQLVAGEPHPELTALSFGAVIGLMANLSDAKEGTPMLRLILSLLGGASIALLMSVNPLAAAATGGALIGGALTVGEDFEGFEKAGVWLMYAVALATAMFVTLALAPKLFVASLAVNVFQATVWGIFLAFAAGLSRLKWQRDEVLTEFREAEADFSAESKETMKNGRQLYEQVIAELGRASEADTQERAREIATTTARALITLTRRAHDLRVASELKLQRHLPTRVVELHEKIRAEDDATVRRELQATLDELVEQVRVRKRIEVARARLEARQQRCFTAFERLHVALIQGGGGAHADSALEESVSSLEKLSEELRWRNLSVDELCEGAEVDSAKDVVAELVAEQSEAHSDPVVFAGLGEGEGEGEATTGTVLDTASLTDEPRATSNESDGTDCTIGSAVAEQIHVQSDSR